MGFTSTPPTEAVHLSRVMKVEDLPYPNDLRLLLLMRKIQGSGPGFISFSWWQPIPTGPLCSFYYLFHAYTIEVCGKGAASENALSLCQELSVILSVKVSCYLHLALNLLKFYLILTYFYDSHFSLVPWQYLFTKGLITLGKFFFFVGLLLQFSDGFMKNYDFCRLGFFLLLGGNCSFAAFSILSENRAFMQLLYVYICLCVF